MPHLRTALAAWLLASSAGLVGVAPRGARAEAPPRLLVGLDAKAFFEPSGFRDGPGGADASGSADASGGGDRVLVIDLADPARPRIAHALPLSNSVYGPPTNLAITPDGRLGLVASSILTRREGGAWAAEPDDRLHVVDLAADPPRHVETLRVGRQPSGLAVAPGGDLALVANRAGRSLTVLRIEGGAVRVAGTVEMGDEVAGVTIAPDGRRALAVKNAAAKVAVLAIDGDRVTYDPAHDVPAGAGVYGADFTPDGRLALTADTGPASDGHADTATVIALDGQRPRVVAHVTVGDTPETLQVSPDGRHAVVALVRGSAAAHGSPTYTRNGAAVLLGIRPEGVRVVDVAEAGALPEGVAFGPDGRHVYLGNYVDRTLQVYRIEGDRLVDTGFALPLPGQPASIGARARGR